MLIERVTFQSSQGALTEATAEVMRPSRAANVTRAIALLGGSLVAAGIFIFIPIVHLVTTWALPLLGIVLARGALRRKVAVYDAQGACPSCGETVRLPGGDLEDPSWQICLRCGAPIRVALDDTAG